ncbi:FAD-dependent oxidoreductase [Aquamicrobium segne]|uniref:FAD-dependent oxidoreductase n=1 Tax=Aquamicrobium segne TaxID=469547 RepID=A0ABW0H257_9HYPH
MTLPLQVDVLVIGAGPAGLAAATELAAHCTVLVVERESAAGGIPRHCGHYPFGMREFYRPMRGPDYARGLVKRAQTAGVNIALNVNVVALHPGPCVSVTADSGLATIKARRVLLATGVRESSRAQRLIGGTKPGGVLSTGALQGLVYLENSRPFRRPVILGTELVSFSAIMTCAHAGIRPIAMIEPNTTPTARWPLSLYPRLKNIPVHLSTRILAIEGRDRVEGVIVEGPDGKRHIETDGVIVSGRFRSEATLLADGPVKRDPASGGPAIDMMGRCTDPHYYAAGNMLHPVETAGWCWAEGQKMGRTILADLQDEMSSPDQPAPPPSPTRQPIVLAGEALSWVVPQFTSKERAFDHLQLRVNRPVKGRLSVHVDGREVASYPVHTRPERRILLPIPSQDGAMSIILEEAP